MGLLSRTFRREKPAQASELTYTRESARSGLSEHDVLTFSKSDRNDQVKVHIMDGRIAVDVGPFDRREHDITIQTNKPESEERKEEIATQAARLAFTLLGENQ